jgi:aromatic ring-cleaving dioxygenase
VRRPLDGGSALQATQQRQECPLCRSRSDVFGWLEARLGYHGGVSNSSSGAVRSPLGSNSISSYHAHIYWTRPEERVLALELREWLAQRFAVALGRVHDQPVGPHTQPMYQVAFAPEVFARLASWLMLNRTGLSVLIHPNTGRARDDHLLHALWLGTALPIRGEVLPNEPGTDDISAPVVNTTPDRPSE